MRETEGAVREEVRQAIADERERRDYWVVVGEVCPVRRVWGVPVPEGLRTYIATTTCTVKHDHGIPCVWFDYVFLINGELRVMLQNDFGRIGMLMEDSARQIMEKLRGELKEQAE
ncbi:MAG TPA: hypothetical protein VKR06_46465 [Ktedonosporobacter sp.]|nr:hypothetical protein [Ktedonosporobacter sp.]